MNGKDYLLSYTVDQIDKLNIVIYNKNYLSD